VVALELLDSRQRTIPTSTMSDQQRNKRKPKAKADNSSQKKYRKVVRPDSNKEEGSSSGGGGAGVSKIKAALRQTRRLLAKENISASVRQEADRKLIALEDELLTKEQQQKEKNNAQRYHKVRFFGEWYTVNCVLLRAGTGAHRFLHCCQNDKSWSGRSRS
jgi:hypothetical protein